MNTGHSLTKQLSLFLKPDNPPELCITQKNSFIIEEVNTKHSQVEGWTIIQPLFSVVNKNFALEEFNYKDKSCSFKMDAYFSLKQFIYIYINIYMNDISITMRKADSLTNRKIPLMKWHNTMHLKLLVFVAQNLQCFPRSLPGYGFFYC